VSLLLAPIYHHKCWFAVLCRFWPLCSRSLIQCTGDVQRVRLVSRQMSHGHFDWLFNKHNTNYFLNTDLYTMMMLTVKWSKHVSAIYKCYINLLDYQIIDLLSFGFQVFILLASTYHQFITSHSTQTPIVISVAHGTKRHKWQNNRYYKLTVQEWQM
jgi:hypothetical protein